MDEMITKAQYDSDMARHERNFKRLWILSIILLLALVGTNAGHLIYESQFSKEVTFTQEAESDVENGVIMNGSGSGTVNYYGDESKANNDHSVR